MAGKLAYERYHWFHGQIKAGYYPNARCVAERFGISQKQAQRNIDFIRDRLEDPLFYHPSRKGYEYEDAGFELPPIWCNEDELLGLCLALRLASTLPDRALKGSLHKLLEKFLNFRFLDSPPTLTDIIHPLHLLCYMGSWHLIAFCTLKNGLRDFALSRIRKIDSVSEPVRIPGQIPSVMDYVRNDFGVMSGAESVAVCLKYREDSLRGLKSFVSACHAMGTWLTPESYNVMNVPEDLACRRSDKRSNR